MIAERYAKSLLLAAKEKGELEKVYEDIKKLTDLFRSEPVKFMIKSPAYSKRKKDEFVRSISGNLGLSYLTVNLISLMIKKGRERFLEEVLKYFVLFYYREKGIEKVTLLCADEPDKSWVDELKSKLEEKLMKKVELEIKVKPELLAGFEIEGTDWKISVSAREFLKELTSQSK